MCVYDGGGGEGGREERACECMMDGWEGGECECMMGGGWGGGGTCSDMLRHNASQWKKFSWQTLTELFLLILGRKLELSLRNVISRALRNLFIPRSRAVGL